MLPTIVRRRVVLKMAIHIRIQPIISIVEPVPLCSRPPINIHVSRNSSQASGVPPAHEHRRNVKKARNRKDRTRINISHTHSVHSTHIHGDLDNHTQYLTDRFELYRMVQSPATVCAFFQGFLFSVLAARYDVTIQNAKQKTEFLGWTTDLYYFEFSFCFTVIIWDFESAMSNSDRCASQWKELSSRQQLRWSFKYIFDSSRCYVSLAACDAGTYFRFPLVHSFFSLCLFRSALFMLYAYILGFCCMRMPFAN